MQANQKNQGVEEVRTLLGVVSAEKAPKGVFVITSKFSPDAKKFVKENPRIELIDGHNLQILLNKFCGANWPIHIDFLISRSSITEEKAKKNNRGTHYKVNATNPISNAKQIKS